MPIKNIKVTGSNTNQDSGAKPAGSEAQNKKTAIKETSEKITTLFKSADAHSTPQSSGSTTNADAARREQLLDKKLEELKAEVGEDIYNSALAEYQEQKEAEEREREELLSTVNDTKGFCEALGCSSIEELRETVGETGIIDFDMLENGLYTKEELKSIVRDVQTAIDEIESEETIYEDDTSAQGTDTESSQEGGTATQEKVESLEALNKKYNLNIDFSGDIPEEKLKLLQQAYIVEEQAGTIDAARSNMLEYFDSLGVIDKAYDGLKDILGSDLTQEGINEYYDNEKLKNEFLASVIQNGGEISLSEGNNQETLSNLIGYNLKNCKSIKEIEEYAIQNLGLTEEDFKAYKQQFPKVYDEDGNLTQEALGMIGEDALKTTLADFVTENMKIEDSLSFEKAYQLATGVEYNEELISQIFNSRDTYKTVATLQQNAVSLEQTLANLSPGQALAYFDIIAATSGENVTGEELFNNYYQDLFEKYPDKFSYQNFDGLTCSGISVQDGYLWQEISFPDVYDDNYKEFIAKDEFLYKKTDENGNVKYYKVVNLEDSTKLKCNMFSEDSGEDYMMTGVSAGNTLSFFTEANKSIKQNNLYLQKIKEDYDKEYGEGSFDTVLEEYPKMCEEAFGKNVLMEKLGTYKNDMDSYTKNLSQALSIGCFAASFIPGVSIAAWVPLVAAASDNILDGINIASCNLSNEEKLELAKKLGIDTLKEAGMLLVGMGINRFSNVNANKFVASKIANGNQFIANHAAGVESLVEYGIDNAASVAWDTTKGIIDGSLFDKNGKFNWDRYGKMVLGDMLFNTADLRNGIALYRNLSGSGIDLGNGTKFEINSDTKEVKFTYEDGSVVNIDDGKITLKTKYSEVDLSFDEASGNWVLPNGTKFDLMGANSNINSNIVTSSALKYVDNMGVENTEELKASVKNMMENDTIRELVENGVLDQYSLTKLAKGGQKITDNLLDILDNNPAIKQYVSNRTIKGNDLLNLAEMDKADFDVVSDLMENNPTIKGYLETGKLTGSRLIELAESPDTLTKTLELFDDSKLQELLNSNALDADDVVDLAKSELCDKLLETLGNEKVRQLIKDKKLYFIDFLEMGYDGKSYSYDNLIKLLNNSEATDAILKEENSDIFSICRQDPEVFDNYIKIKTTYGKMLKQKFNLSDNDIETLAGESPKTYNRVISLLTGSDENSQIIQQYLTDGKLDMNIIKNLASLRSLEDVQQDFQVSGRNINIYSGYTNQGFSEQFETAMNLIKNQDLLEVGKTKNLYDFSEYDYDLINQIFHGSRIDNSLEGFELNVNGRKISLEFDNDAVSEAFLKEHPDYVIDTKANNKVITQEAIDAIEQAIQELSETGVKIPSKIHLTDLFGNDMKPKGEGTVGCFTGDTPHTIYVNTSELQNLNYLKTVVEHEAAHLADYMLSNGMKFMSDSSEYDISKTFSADDLSNSDIRRLLGDYSLKNNQEFVAEVSTMLTNGTVVFNTKTGRYEFSGDSYVNPKGANVSVTQNDTAKINKIMEIYDALTHGGVAKAREV